jgi:PUA domain protein
VASSTSLKSSAQRHIRTGLLEQYPFLAQSISPPAGTSAADGPTESNAPLSEENAPTEEQEEQPSKPSKGGKKKGGGVKKDKGGKGKDKEVETDAKEGGEENLTVLDELWPKKEALGITKW